MGVIQHKKKSVRRKKESFELNKKLNTREKKE